MESREILAEKLYRSTIQRIGSDEHLQVAGLLRDAEKTVVDLDAAIAVRDFLYNDPWQLECSLDLVERPMAPRWFEWPLETRAGHGGGHGAVTGCLVTPHPADPDLMAVVTGWDTGNGARHAFAVGLMDTETLQETAWAARNLYAGVQGLSTDRIMAAVSATMPSGFSDEIAILTDGSFDAVEAALRDATAEIPLLLALLVMEKVRGGIVSRSDGDIMRASLAKPVARGLWGTVSDRLSRRAGNLLAREKSRNGIQAVWYR